MADGCRNRCRRRAVFAFFAPWLKAVLPCSVVIISDKGVNNNTVFGRLVRIEFFPWSHISRVIVATVVFEDRAYPVIALYSHDGQHLVTLGLKKSPTLDQLAEYLEQRDCELHRESSVEA